MIYDLKLAWQNLGARPLQSLITVVVLGLAIALSVTITQLNDGLRLGIVQASDAFGVLVVGAKGSTQQLVTSTILLQGNPVGNIPISILTQLQADERVALAIPLAMGDNVGGARIIGTNASFFELRTRQDAPPAFQLASGRLFAQDFEAILGSQVARDLGLVIGDRFMTQHGVERGLESDAHGVPHQVVGILESSNTPYDKAVLTTVESVIHVHEEEERQGSAPGESDHAAESEHEEITAILVRPIGFMEMNQLWQEFYLSTDAQAAFPGKELGGLFEMLNQGQAILVWVGYLAALMAGLTLFLAIYSASAAREQFIAIMRTVGASRLTVFRMVIFETVLLALLGAAVGRLLGLGAAWLIANQITAQSAIPIPIRYLPGLEPYLWGIPILLSILAGVVPALQAYRVNVIEKLFAS